MRARARPSRWRLVRDVLVFHVKLTLDGLKDLVLGPISLAAAAIGLLVPGSDPSRYLAKVKRLGKGYDEWIDLYDEQDRDSRASGQAGLDDHLARLERALAAQRGPLSLQAKDAIERALNTLDELTKTHPPPK